MYYGRKKGLIIGIIVAVVVILIAIIGVLVVLKTDLFKSNKTLFWKYASLQLESLELTQNMQLEEIEKLKAQNPYTLQGELTLSSSDEESDSLGNIKLNINEESDKTNEYSHINGKIAYENNTIFDLDYVKNDNVYALKSDEIVTAYLGVRNENLKVLFQKLGMQDTSSIPDEITLNNYSEILKFSKVDIEHIKETYSNVIANTITSESYSRQTGAILEKNGISYKTTSYRLDLSSEQIAAIFENILNTLKTDSITLNLIVEKAKLLGWEDDEITIEELTTKVDEAISEISKEEFEDISFVVYNYKGEAIESEVIVKNKSKTTIDAKKDNIEISYESYEEENNVTIVLINNVTTTRSNIQVRVDINGETQVNVDLINTGSAVERSLNTTYEIEIINEDIQGNITYSQTLEFIDELENMIELNETNVAILNDYSKEDLIALLQAIEERIVQVMNEKVQAIFTYNMMNNLNSNNSSQEEKDEMSVNTPADAIRNISQGQNNIYSPTESLYQSLNNM